MSSEDGERLAGTVFGTPVSEATEALVSGTAARDPAEVRALLDRVSEGGAVTEDAVDDAVTDAAMTLSTAETRTELAAMALSDARETATPVSTLDAVRSRLAEFQSVVDSLERRTDALGSDLRTLDPRPAGLDALSDLATELRRITVEANDAHRSADEVQVELEEFRRWLTDADARFEELDDDAAALEQSIAALEETVDGLGAGDGGEDAAASSGNADAGAVWVDAALRHRVVDLLLTDARAELADLRRWAAVGEPGDTAVDTDAAAFDARADALEARFEEFERRLSAVDDRLDDCRRPSWADRHGDRLSGFETALDDLERPVPWGEVRASLERHRPPATDSA